MATGGTSQIEAHALSAEETLLHLNSNKELGLTASEAARRSTLYGPNRLEEEKKISAFRILANQFKNSLIDILLIAAVISAFLGQPIDAIVILVIVILVALLGFSQEYRTERTLDALKKMQTHTCRVIRDGSITEIESEGLVPGDIIVVSAGDRIPADLRVLESFNIQTDEAVLTGESLPVLKGSDQVHEDSPVSDRTDMLFSGTAVSNGKGRAVVTSTGMSTEVGKIAAQITVQTSGKRSATSLERRMNEIGKKIGLVVLIIVALIVIGSVSEELFLTGTIGIETFLAILLFGVALAVAAIPEALPAILVGSLAIGAHRMAKSNALARNLSAVETLGGTQIICADKTGTLTKGEMTVTEIYVRDIAYNVSGVGYEPVGKLEKRESSAAIDNSLLEEFAKAMILCNDAVLIKDQETKRWMIQGDPTEGALIVLAEKIGQSQQLLQSSFPRVWEIPFSSESKRMTTVHTLAPSRIQAFMKGAPEAVLDACSFEQTESGLVVLDPIRRKRIHEVAEYMASRALRVLAIAERDVSNVNLRDQISLEKEFAFVGLVGMIDPPRQEAIDSIRTAKKVGMTPVMITGDHKSTALAIASEMGIYGEGDIALTGSELQNLSEEEFDQIVQRVRVYARVSPFDKLRIVDAWKRKNRIVAMTGDGVNDAPALKRADIGIAMGITGTEVAKDAADLILLDDNFATIINAVALGRWIQDNVKKYLAYLLSANLLEIAVMTIGVILASFFIADLEGGPLIPLLAVQLLYINLATDGLPALAVGIGPPDPDVMERKVSPELTVFSPDVFRFIVWVLIVETPILALTYLAGMPEGIDAARTRLFLTFVFVELAIALSCRSLRFTVSKARPGRWLVLSVIWEVVLLVTLIEIPVAREALHFTFLTFGDAVWATLAAIATFAVLEARKLVVFRNRVSS